MRTVTYRLVDLVNATLNLGFAGENQRTRILFDAKKVFEEYPDAIPAITVKPPTGSAYPAVTEKDGNYVVWDILDSDLIYDGNGEVQIAFVEGEVVVKSYIAKTRIARSIIPTGQIPTPLENFLIAANLALEEIPQAIIDALTQAKQSGEFDGADGVGITSIAKTGTSGLVDTYTITLTDGNEYTFTVTNGEKGDPGKDGTDGKDGADGKDGKDGENGKDGKDGEDGTDGVGIASIAKTGTSGLVDTYTITLTNGQHYDFTVTNGQDGQTPTVPVTDVQVNGSSVLENGVAKIPIANGSTPGVMVVRNSTDGVFIDSNNRLNLAGANDNNIKTGATNYKAITPYNQHKSAFFALAKLAGVDLANETVTVGQYPAPALTAIQKMLGVYEAPWELIREDEFTNATEEDVEISVDDIGNTFELTDVIIRVQLPKNTDVSVGNYGITRVYYGSTGYYSGEFGAKTLTTENNYIYNAFLKITQDKGMLEINYNKYNTTGNGSIVYRQGSDPFNLTSKTFTKAVVKAVTGKIKVTIWGKRKWN